MTPKEFEELARFDAWATRTGRFNRELYQRLGEMEDGMAPFWKAYSDRDRVAILAYGLEAVLGFSANSISQRLEVFVEAFMLGNAYAARYGQVPARTEGA